MRGLPTVLVEACGLRYAVVATRCSGGSVEILEDGRSVAWCRLGIRGLGGGDRVQPSGVAANGALRQRAGDFTIERAVAAYRRILFGSPSGADEPASTALRGLVAGTTLAAWQAICLRRLAARDIANWWFGSRSG